MSVVASFEIPFSRCLDADGVAVGPLPAFAEDRAALVALYRAMVLTRSFDHNRRLIVEASRR